MPNLDNKTAFTPEEIAQIKANAPFLDFDVNSEGKWFVRIKTKGELYWYNALTWRDGLPKTFPRLNNIGALLESDLDFVELFNERMLCLDDVRQKGLESQIATRLTQFNRRTANKKNATLSRSGRWAEIAIRHLENIRSELSGHKYETLTLFLFEKICEELGGCAHDLPSYSQIISWLKRKNNQSEVVRYFQFLKSKVK